MKHFTIDTDNNITFHPTLKAARDTGAGVFSSEVQLADLVGNDPKRLLDIFNSLPGVKPVTKFKNRKIATERIWRAIQNLGGTPAEPAAQQDTTPATPFDGPVATPGGQAADVAPVKAKASKKATPAKKSPKGEAKAKKPAEKKAKTDRSNKKAGVIEMMKKAKGATLPEIMAATEWQAHTVRGFISILGSKGGETIESFKNAVNERTYRIAK